MNTNTGEIEQLNKIGEKLGLATITEEELLKRNFTTLTESERKAMELIEASENRPEELAWLRWKCDAAENSLKDAFLAGFRSGRNFIGGQDG